MFLHENSELTERQKQALIRLQNAEPDNIFREATEQKCQAPKLFGTCKKDVRHTLVTCGHAALCGDCVHTSSECIICRDPIPRDSESKVLRLYEELKVCQLVPEEFESETWKDDSPALEPNVKRLLTFFEVALHYHTPLVVFKYIKATALNRQVVSKNSLLDPFTLNYVLVEWSEKVFKRHLRDLSKLYQQPEEEMCSFANVRELTRIGITLNSLIDVMTLLDNPTSSTNMAFTLKHFLEASRRTVQHLAVMVWLARHDFFSKIPKKHADLTAWTNAYKEKKIAAAERAYPKFDPENLKRGEKPSSNLFIDVAVDNILAETEAEYLLPQFSNHVETLRNPGYKKKENNGKFPSKGLYYPMELRDFVDFLFLSSAKCYIAKLSIFLYYTLDRYTSDVLPMLEDYRATLGVNDYDWNETELFFLIDEGSSEALNDAFSKLEDVPNLQINPLVIQKLLEYGKFELALKYLQSGKKMEAFTENDHALTAVRVFVENNKAAEALLFVRQFLEQLEVEERKANSGGVEEAIEMSVALLVGEMCCLAIDRKANFQNLLKQALNPVEELVVERCLLNRVKEYPVSSCGAILISYFMIHSKMEKVEEIAGKLREFEDKFLIKCKDKSEVQRVKRMRKHRENLLRFAREYAPKQTEIQAEVSSEESSRSECLSEVANDSPLRLLLTTRSQYERVEEKGTETPSNKTGTSGVAFGSSISQSGRSTSSSKKLTNKHHLKEGEPKTLKFGNSPLRNRGAGKDGKRGRELKIGNSQFQGDSPAKKSPRSSPERSPHSQDSKDEYR